MKQPVGLSVRRMSLVLAAGGVLWLVGLGASMGAGPARADWVGWLLGHDVSAQTRLVVVHARLPRTILASLVGAGLAAGGAALQALFRNPLADPFIVGTSGGATLATAIATVVGPGAVGWLAGPIGAFVGALGALAAVYALALRVPGAGPSRILLVGLAVNLFCGAAVTLVLALGDPARTHRVVLWLMGTLSSGASWAQLAALAIMVVAGVAWMWRRARWLDAWALGGPDAATLGVDTARLQREIALAVSLVAGAAASAAGLVGFVGLVVPHGVRLVVGADHRVVVPLSALSGAAVLCLADAAVRASFSALGTELPVGVVTALIGSPLFVWLLLRPLTPSAEEAAA